MGKLLQYEELCAIQSLKLTQSTSDLKYTDYKDTLSNTKRVSKEVSKEVSNCIDAPDNCPNSTCECFCRVDVSNNAESRFPWLLEPLFLDKVSESIVMRIDDNQHHEKMD